MRGMKSYLWLFVLAIVLIMVSSTVVGGGRIAFSSDRVITPDLELWIMRDDGTHQTQFTTGNFDAKRPSYSLDGKHIVYDHDGELWIKPTSGGPEQMITGAMHCPNDCEDPDAGPRATGSAEDFLIVYNRKGNPSLGTVDRIYVATVDVSVPFLINNHPLSFDPDEPMSYHPAWCGTNDAVWSRWVNPCPGENCSPNQLYPRELCTVGVDENGAFGTQRCVFPHTANQYPSCGLLNGQDLTVAFARSDGDMYLVEFFELPHEICTMDFDEFASPDPEELCFVNQEDPLNTYDDNKPVWKPDGLQIAFASDRTIDGIGPPEDYEIWVMNSEDGTGQMALTTNPDVDDDPDWGGAILP